MPAPYGKKSKHREDRGSEDVKGRKRDREDKPVAEEEPKKRKIEPEQQINEEQNEIPEHLRLSNFRISESTVKNLEARGIRSLFEIQAATFDAIFDGKDVLARARTGTGKTLGFALPVIEKLALDTSFQAKRGRAPRVMVLCPTRDLAKQVCGDFESISGNRLTALPVYGGTPYQAQTQALRDGVDVIVGTPGRILDHIQHGSLKLNAIKFIILDEADEMLDARGFQDDMFNTLKHIEEQKSARDYQTLLFSATVPESVMETIQRFMKSDYERIDLVGDAKNRTNQNIRHVAMPASYQARADIIADVVNVYGRSGLTVIFCATKADANELGAHEKLKQDSAVLHGDIAQQSRESTMKAFREGKYKCIICTDVLARGLDIPQVDLVINCQPPKDTESYVHRSGRTGRAGRKGVCVTFYKNSEEYLLQIIKKRTGVNFEIMAAPLPEDIIKATTEDAFRQIDTVNPQVLPYFMQSAKELIEKHGAENAVAAALAFVSGYHQGIPTRSLLSGVENLTTLYFRLAYEIQNPGYVRNIVKREFPDLQYEDARGWRMTKDMMGVVFDVNSSKVEVKEDGKVLITGKAFEGRGKITLSALKELPELADFESKQNSSSSGYNRNGNSRNYGRNNGGSYNNSGNYNRGGYNNRNGNDRRGGGGYGSRR